MVLVVYHWQLLIGRHPIRICLIPLSRYILVFNWSGVTFMSWSCWWICPVCMPIVLRWFHIWVTLWLLTSCTSIYRCKPWTVSCSAHHLLHLYVSWVFCCDALLRWLVCSNSTIKSESYRLCISTGVFVLNISIVHSLMQDLRRKLPVTRTLFPWHNTMQFSLTRDISKELGIGK